MRALLLCLAGLIAASPDFALADMKLSPKAAPGANEVRYFTAIDGLMGGNADVQAGINIVLKALEAPIRQIAEIAGVEGSIVVGKILEN